MASVNILLTDAGKKYSGQWVFRHLDLLIPANSTLAILGPNGSGKSTLLQILAGASLLNEGSIQHTDEKPLDPELVFRHVSLAAPYLELIEEFTMQESLEMHFGFKRMQPGMTLSSIAELSGLAHALHKPVRFFSSGMKQRLRLTLACLSETSLLFLDEPCANLDSEGVEWYAKIMDRYGKNRTVIVCSNSHKEEYFMCDKSILLTDYKNTGRQPVGLRNV